jgi:hypothetical protein
MGATTALFSVVNAVLLKSLPFPVPDRIVQVTGLNAKGDVLRNFADPTFEAIAERNRSISAIAEMNSYYVTVSNDGEAMRLSASWVSSPFFDVLGVKPAAGHSSCPKSGSAALTAAVISYALWQRLFAGTNRAIGAKPSGSSSITVVGVLRKGSVSPADRRVPRARDRSAIPELYRGQWRLLAREAERHDRPGAAGCLARSPPAESAGRRVYVHCRRDRSYRSATKSSDRFGRSCFAVRRVGRAPAHRVHQRDQSDGGANGGA